MTDAVAASGRANGVSNRRKILFLPAPEFHAWHDLAARIQSWQDRVQEKFSILSEMPIFECLRK